MSNLMRDGNTSATPVVMSKGSASRCYEDTSIGQDEMCQPADAVLHGDTATNSSRPKLNNDGMLVDGPFGGKKPQS